VKRLTSFKKISAALAGNLFLLCSLVGCATSSDNPAEKYAKVPEKALFYQAVKDIDSRDYQDSIEKFEALDARYPFGDYAEKGQLYIIYSYYESDQLPQALLSAQRFIHLHPDSAHIDYAYFMKGLLNYQQNLGIFDKYFKADLAARDLSSARQSFVDFSLLVETYPKSEYRSAAIQYMIYLRNLMADQELQVAQFYLKRSAYLTAIERANIVLKEYQGSPSAKAALLVLIESYASLHLEDLAEMYQQIYDYN
jgi:outer membrane protein assembly factor BamD